MGQMIGNVGVKTGNLVTTDNGGDRELCAINLFLIFFFLYYFFFLVFCTGQFLFYGRYV